MYNSIGQQLRAQRTNHRANVLAAIVGGAVASAASDLEAAGVPYVYAVASK